jgi:succinate dehydrogenase / fumarate reductase flavoprotein subunit
VADFLEFAELMCLDALTREESCGGHFREEYQTEDGEALRNDKDFCHASCWEFTGVGNPPNLHKESLALKTSSSHRGATSEPNPSCLAPEVARLARASW